MDCKWAIINNAGFWGHTVLTSAYLPTIDVNICSMSDRVFPCVGNSNPRSPLGLKFSERMGVWSATIGEDYRRIYV